MVFKLLSGIYDCGIACQLVKPNHFVARGHHLRLIKKHVRYDLRKFYFGNRSVSIWNSLPVNIINADTVSLFERRLDNFWTNQACCFVYKADLTGTGSRSQL